MEVEAIKVHALFAADLNNPQHFSLIYRYGLAADRLECDVVAAFTVLVHGDTSGMRFFRRVPPQAVFLAIVQVPMEEQSSHDLLVGIAERSSVPPDPLKLFVGEDDFDVLPLDWIVHEVRPIIWVPLELWIGTDRSVLEVFRRALGLQAGICPPLSLCQRSALGRS